MNANCTNSTKFFRMHTFSEYIVIVLMEKKNSELKKKQKKTQKNTAAAALENALEHIIVNF